MQQLVFMLALAVATPAQWRADIDYLATELPKRHPNPFVHVSRDDFLAQLDAVKADVDGLNDAQIAIRIQQVVAQIRDAHTESDTRLEPWTYFPLRVRVFPDGIYVTKTADASRAACGAKLVAIDGMSVAEAYARTATVASAENDPWTAVRQEGLLVRAEVLELTGVTAASDRARFTFEGANGRFDLDLQSVPASAMRAIFDAYDFVDASPLYLQDPHHNYWYRWDAARQLLYIKYNVCAADPARPFGTFASEIFNIIDHQTLTAIVVDVRNNTGGNSEVARPLIDGLRSRHLSGRLYLIVGRETFSSGLLNAIDLRSAGATLVGEPTGGKPNAYGEQQSFALPNSRVTVFHSTKFFQTVPGDPPSLAPDRRVDVNAADFFAMRDPVLDSIVPPPASAAATIVARRRAANGLPRCPQ